MRDLMSDIGLRKHLRVVGDNYPLGDFLRNLFPFGKNAPSELPCLLSMVNIERKHPEIPHRQVLDFIPDRILGQRDRGNVKLMIALQQMLQISPCMWMQRVLRLVQAD